MPNGATVRLMPYLYTRFIEGESSESQSTVVVFDNKYSYDESIKLSHFSLIWPTVLDYSSYSQYLEI